MNRRTPSYSILVGIIALLGCGNGLEQPTQQQLDDPATLYATASSRDYVGPCHKDERALPPVYVSLGKTDNKRTWYVDLPDKGRMALGISCVSVMFRVIYPTGATWEHACGKHGFGWYLDLYNLPAGRYQLEAEQRLPGVPGYWEGHGTMDVHPFYGNNGAVQYPNCPRP